MATARLEGQAVIVTGASTGIGEAIARRCALEGARVLVHGRDGKRTRKVAAGLATEAASFTGDLGDPEVCEALVEEATRAFGRIDGLVNNAALTTRSDLASTTPELLDRLLAVNLRAPLMIVRAAMGELRASRGSVVNIGSINAYCGEPELLAYSLSKGALMTMTRNLANAHASERVRFNVLNVGWTLTDNEDAIIREQGYPSGWHLCLKPAVAPSGALLAPEQVALHAVHWLSPDSAPVTGAVIDVEQYPLQGRPYAGEKLSEPCP